MLHLQLQLAWRYLLGTKTNKNISTMAIICFSGILIGSCALALVLSIMRGFEKVTHEKMQGIHSQIIMRGYGQRLDANQIATVLKNEFPNIKAFSPSTIKQVIVQSKSDDENTTVVALKGIEPLLETGVSTIDTKITRHIALEKTQQKLPFLTQNDRIIIGEKLAENLEISIGDTITLLFATEQQTQKKKISLKSAPVVVSGFFKTGIDEFDTSLAIGSLDFLRKLFPDEGVQQINIQLAPHADENKTIARLKARSGLEVYSWKDLYPALVSALKLEKYVMFFIIALITLVASMNIISLLFMQITQKRGDIAILKAMGLKSTYITQTFVILGMTIALIGSLCGLLVAALIGIVLQRFPFITLPDAYYVTHLPIALEWHLFALVLCVVLTISFVASWIPARRTRSIIIADILRFEG